MTPEERAKRFFGPSFGPLASAVAQEIEAAVLEAARRWREEHR
jgi:hypothetical protein